MSDPGYKDGSKLSHMCGERQGSLWVSDIGFQGLECYQTTLSLHPSFPPHHFSLVAFIFPELPHMDEPLSTAPVTSLLSHLIPLALWGTEPRSFLS